MISFIRLALIFSFTFTGIVLLGQKNVIEYEVNGLKVIQKQVPGEVVAVRLYVRGGTANYSLEQQGIEQLAFEMALYGDSKNRSASEIADETRSLGVGLSAKSGYDYGYLGATFVERYWNESWKLFSELLLQPAMNKDDFNRIRDELYARNRRNNETAEQYIDVLSMHYTFSGTDYEKIPFGTEGSLYGLSREDVVNYYSNLLTKTNCYLVVVGDVSREAVESAVLGTFSALPVGETRVISAIDSLDGAGANIQHQDLDLNHIEGRAPAPSRYSAEGVANMLAMQLLSDRLNQAAAANRNMDYAPTAVAGMEHRYPTNTLYISTGNPAEELDLMVNTVQQTMKDGFSEGELEAKKPFFLTLNYLGQESMDAQAHALGDAEAAGDWRKAFGLTEDVLNTTIEDVNRVLGSQFEWINWTYLGNLSQVKTDDFVQIQKPIEKAPEKQQE